MRVGFALGNIGPIGTMDNLIKIAERAEALAYGSLWAVERLLWPVKPQSPYPVTPDGSLPEEYKHVLDPLEALMFVAARTKSVALGNISRQTKNVSGREPQKCAKNRILRRTTSAS